MSEKGGESDAAGGHVAVDLLVAAEKDDPVAGFQRGAVGGLALCAVGLAKTMLPRLLLRGPLPLATRRSAMFEGTRTAALRRAEPDGVRPPGLPARRFR
jgi:hypothetical protein